MSVRNGKKCWSSRATKQQLLNELETLQRRNDELERSADESPQVEQAPRESEAQYRELFEASPIGIWVEDYSAAKRIIDRLCRRGVKNFPRYFCRRPEVLRAAIKAVRIIDINPVGIRLYGARTKDELQRAMRDLGEWVGKSYLEFQASLFATLAEGRPAFTAEYTGRSMDGVPVVVRAATQILETHRDTWSRVITSVEDVTEQRRTEEALRLTQFAIDRAGDAAFWLDRDGRVVYANDTASNMLGYSREELLTFTVPDFDPHASLEDVARAFERVKTRGHSRFEARYRTKSGANIPVEVSGYYLAYGDKELMACYSRDITERKRAEEALHESERRYRELFEASPIGIWVEDYSAAKRIIDRLRRRGVKNFPRYFRRRPEVLRAAIKAVRIIDINPAGIRLYGARTKDELQRAMRDLGKWVGTPYMEFQASLFATFAEGRLAFTAEYTGRRMDGAPVVVRATAKIIEARRDSWSRVITSVEDITERKQTEEALRESEARYRSLIDLSPEAIVVHCDGEIVLVNPAGARLFGAERPEEMIGKPAIELVHPDFREFVRERMRRVRDDKVTIELIEEEFQRLDGSKFLAEVAAAALEYKGRPAIQVVIRDITERKRAEEALRETSEKLSKLSDEQRLLLEHTRDFVYRHNEHGVFTYVSPAAEQITGYSVEEWRTRYSDYYTDNPINKKAIEYTEDTLRTGREYPPYLIELHHKDERRIVLEVKERPYFEDGKVAGIIGVCRDVTEREQAQKALRESEARLAEAQHIAKLGYWGWDIESDQIHRSDTIFDIFGRTSRTMGTSYDDFVRCIHPDDRELMQSAVNQALNDKKPYSIEYRTRLPNKQVRFVVEFGEARFDRAGKPTWLTGTVQDITDLKQTEERARQHAAELAHVLRRHTLGEMASSLAHELNQPLTAIATYSDICLRKERSGKWKSGERKTTLKQIHEQAVRAGEIMRGIRHFVQRSEPTAAPAHINGIVREAVDLVAVELRTNEVELTLELEDGLPQVLADAIEIEQVVLNLVTNGIEAMMESEAGQRQLAIATSMTGGDTIEVAVRDAGPGLPADQMDKAFEPFHSTKPNGMGMGLSISRTIIEAHGGRLWAEPDSGHGATFRLTLPVLHEGT